MAKTTTGEPDTEAEVTLESNKNQHSFSFIIPKGEKGSDGKAATIEVGKVETGSVASVINEGTESEAKLNFVLPKGDKGDTGSRWYSGNIEPDDTIGENDERGKPRAGDMYLYLDSDDHEAQTYIKLDNGEWSSPLGTVTGIEGKPATIKVGSVTSTEPNTPVTITNVGNSSDLILNFTFPKPEKGENGKSASIKIGKVTTDGDEITVSNSGTDQDVVLDFNFPTEQYKTITSTPETFIDDVQKEDGNIEVLLRAEDLDKTTLIDIRTKKILKENQKLKINIFSTDGLDNYGIKINLPIKTTYQKNLNGNTGGENNYYFYITQKEVILNYGDTLYLKANTLNVINLPAYDAFLVRSGNAIIDYLINDGTEGLNVKSIKSDGELISTDGNGNISGKKIYVDHIESAQDIITDINYANIYVLRSNDSFIRFPIYRKSGEQDVNLDILYNKDIYTLNFSDHFQSEKTITYNFDGYLNASTLKTQNIEDIKDTSELAVGCQAFSSVSKKPYWWDGTKWYTINSDNEDGFKNDGTEDLNVTSISSDDYKVHTDGDGGFQAVKGNFEELHIETEDHGEGVYKVDVDVSRNKLSYKDKDGIAEHITEVTKEGASLSARDNGANESYSSGEVNVTSKTIFLISMNGSTGDTSQAIIDEEKVLLQSIDTSLTISKNNVEINKPLIVNKVAGSTNDDAFILTDKSLKLQPDTQSNIIADTGSAKGSLSIANDYFGNDKILTLGINDGEKFVPVSSPYLPAEYINQVDTSKLPAGTLSFDGDKRELRCWSGDTWLHPIYENIRTPTVVATEVKTYRVEFTDSGNTYINFPNMWGANYGARTKNNGITIKYFERTRTAEERKAIETEIANEITDPTQKAAKLEEIANKAYTDTTSYGNFPKYNVLQMYNRNKQVNYNNYYFDGSIIADGVLNLGKVSSLTDENYIAEGALALDDNNVLKQYKNSQWTDLNSGNSSQSNNETASWKGVNEKVSEALTVGNYSIKVRITSDIIYFDFYTVSGNSSITGYYENKTQISLEDASSFDYNLSTTATTLQIDYVRNNSNILDLWFTSTDTSDTSIYNLYFFKNTSIVVAKLFKK